MNREFTISLAVGAVLLVAAVSAILFMFYMQRETQEAERAGMTQGLQIVDLRRSNDLDSALQTYEAVISSATASPQTIASSVLAGSDIRYLQDGNIADAIRSIQELKEVVENDDVRPFLRASAVLYLASWPWRSAYNPDVVDEIFKDEPYRALLATAGGDNPLILQSVRNLILHSYRIYPTHTAAIMMADNFIRQLYLNRLTGNETTDNTSRNIARAEEYLAKAADLYNSTTVEKPNNPLAYSNYLSMRAAVLGGLADFKGGEHVKGYRQGYEDLLAHLSSNDAMPSFKALSGVWYAFYLLKIDNDVSAAREQLDRAVALVQNDQDEFDRGGVEWSLKHGRLSSEFPEEFQNLQSISPEFKAFVESIE